MPSGEFDETQWGCTVGAGVEAAVTDLILTRLEYRYTDFGDLKGTIAPFSVQERVDLTTHAIRAGISWKL